MSRTSMQSYKLIIVSVALTIGLAPSRAFSDALRIGAVIPLSGDAARIGAAMQQGMQMAIAESPDSEVTLTVEDDKTADNVAAVAATHKLLGGDGVHVLLNSVVNTARAIAPLATAMKVSTLIVWDSNATVRSLGDYVFGMGVRTETNGRELARYAALNRGARHAAVLSMDDEWSEIIAEAFRSEFEEQGGATLQERIPAGESDLRSLIARLNSAHPDVYFLALFGEPRIAFLKQIESLPVRPPVFTADIFQDELDVLGAAANDTYAAQVLVTEPRFLEKYASHRDAVSGAIAPGIAALGYDAVSLVLKVKKRLEASGHPITRETIHNALAHTTYNGIATRVDYSASRLAEAGGTLVRLHEGKLLPCR